MAASRAMELIHKRTADGKQSYHDAVSNYIQESADAGSRFMKEKKPRKPMSQETKDMLKARREAKKADVAKKFESFWERHGMGTTATATQAVVEAIAGSSNERRKPTDEQRARYAENARNRLLNPAAPSVFGARADADRELARQYRNDPKMRKRLTELNKKLGRRITMYQAILENLLVPAKSEVVVVAPKKKSVRKPKTETPEEYFSYGERPEPTGNQNNMLKRYHASNRARVITLAQRGTQYQKELAQEILYGRIL